MLKLLIGIAIGLIVGWNLLPQPAIVKRFYERISDRFWQWVTSLTLVAISITTGCAVIPTRPAADPYPWRERAMAEIALASVAVSPSIAPDEKPVVGAKCPVCNDPPGDCGVGKTGDGRDCSRCGTCNGDGRIDEQDVRSDGDTGEPEAQSVLEVQKEVTLHATAEQWRDWPIKWYSDNQQAFTDRGWVVRVVLEPAGATDTAYFDVVAPDGEVISFWTPLTLEQVEHLETR